MPSTPRESLMLALYDAFNARDIDTAVAAMTADVDWPNGWEGGRVAGRDAVRAYWERQWDAIDSTAAPIAVEERPDGTIAVAVRLVARDKTGELVADQEARHVYEFRGDLIQRMTIED